jgi:hypothetical protein
VFNAGINTARFVDIDVIPDNLTLQWVSGNQCATENCDITILETFNEENMVLVYRVDVAGEFSLTATANCIQADQIPANNTDVVSGTAIQATQGNSIFADYFED